MTQDCFVIAEAGVNHNGDPGLAEGLVDAAIAAGADAVKFQTFRAETLVRADTPKARYQVENTGHDGGQLAMLKALELSADLHFRLRDRAQAKGVAFMSTPFDLDSLHFLVREVRVPRLKIPSGEITNGPLLLAAARSGLPLILSTGMSTLADIEAALEVLAFGLQHGSGAPARRAELQAALAAPEAAAALRGRVTVLHCTSAYPAPAASANLRAMATLRAAFGLPVGYSDHTEGTAVSVAAAALGATVIEKHFTLDRNLPGPDHRASLEPAELARMIAEIRQVGAALGSSRKQVTADEAENRPIARKSVVARRAIAAGEPFTEENLTAKRPHDGVSPMEFWFLLDRPAPRDFRPDEPVSL